MTAKETFIEMAREWQGAQNYDELATVKLKYFDQTVKGLYFPTGQIDEGLDAEGKNRLFNFDHLTFPTIDMAQKAIEGKTKNENLVVFEIPQATWSKIYFFFEDGKWKYAYETELQGASGGEKEVEK